MKKIFHSFLILSAGSLLGMLFADKSGKKLRDELKRSKSPLKKLCKEIKTVDMNAVKYIGDWAEESEDLQKITKLGKDEFNNIVEKAKDLGEIAKKDAQEKFEKLAENAKDAAKKLKEETVKKITGEK